VIDRSVRLAVTGLLGAGLALTAAFWPGAARDASTPADASPAAAAPDGASLFLSKGCASCHTGPDSTGRFQVGPSLANLSSTAARRVEGLGLEDYVRQSIRAPQAFQVEGFATVSMPTLAVSDSELEALVQYLLG
jgi:mono/diheme cytochrome c family protein